jgi:hypothetical protein
MLACMERFDAGIPLALFLVSLCGLIVLLSRVIPWKMVVKRSRRQRFSPQVFHDWIDDVIFLLERDGDLVLALKAGQQGSFDSGSIFMSRLHSHLRSGALLQHALSSLGEEKLNHLERSALRVLVAGIRGGRSDVVRGLGLVRSSARSQIWYLRKVEAATAQSVLQFWILSSLSPLLLITLILVVPDFLMHATETVSGFVSLTLSCFFYVCGVLLFRSLIQAGRGSLSARVEGQWFGQKILARLAQANKPAQLWVLHEFIEVILISVHSGTSPARAVSQGFDALQSMSRLVFDGIQELLRAHEPLPVCLQKASDLAPPKLKRLLLRLSASSENLRSFTSCLETESESMREEVRSALEEVGGTLSVKLLIPLCLFLFPSVLLLLLGPMIAYMAPLLQ